VSLIELKTDASRKELAWFGVLLLAFLGIVGLLVWRTTGALTAPRYIWGAGVLLATLYYAVPPLRRPMFLGWMYAAYPIGWVVSHVLLGIIYFGLLTPIGKLMAVFRYDPMERRFDRDAASYWIERERNTDPTQYFRQF
jgi:protein-S-isoprenylcysteine O-methyltransferase Ste14